MSDPVTNIEIEDVLSSIRRLVSEGDKLRPDAPRLTQPDSGADEAPLELTREDAVEDVPEASTPAQKPESPKGEVKRFVLTPALRIDEPIETPEAANDGPLVLTAPQLVPDQEATDGDAAAAELSDDEAKAPEQDETADVIDAVEVDDSKDIDSETESLNAWEQALEAEGTDDEAPAEAPAVKQTLEETIAELEAAITHDTDDWEPDGSEGTPVVDWASSAAQAGIFAARGRRPVLVEDAIEIPPRAADEAQPEEASDDDDEDVAGMAAALADRMRHGEKTFDTDDGIGLDASTIFGDDTVIDEAALRDLVAEIVREELQGKLGERITRNVRKLVRREIYRVISSESFD